MQNKDEQKAKAIQMRKNSKTYSEILAVVPVAKSTLSLWLRDTQLSKPQAQRLTAKKRAAQLRGGEARRQQRIATTRLIFDKAIKEVGTLSKRELFLIGVALYWGEGSKERKRPGTSIVFGNTDVNMIRVFRRFLIESLKVSPADIVYSLYIHENRRQSIDKDIAFWRTELGLPELHLKYIYYKKHIVKTKRTNTGENYHGTLRIVVRESSSLLRVISGAIYGINGATCRIV